MNKMMAGMEIKSTGDIDADFIGMMIPHHQGATDMAIAELRYGKNEQLRRIAQDIIVDQQQEIAAMRLPLGQPLPASAPAPTEVSPPINPGHGRAPSSDGPRQAGAALPHQVGDRSMTRSLPSTLLASTFLACSLPAWAGQAPDAASAPDL